MSRNRAEHAAAPAPAAVMPEYRLWEEHWVRCCKELNQWDLLQDFAVGQGNSDPQLVLESAWRQPNWPLMKEALSQVRQCRSHVL